MSKDKNLSSEETRALSLYKDIQVQAQKMLEFAQNDLWDELVQQESIRSHLFEQLKQFDPIESHNSTFQKSKSTLIQSILQIDQQVMHLSQQWMKEMQGTLNAASLDKRLKSAYGDSSK